MRDLEEFLYKFKDDKQIIPHSFTNKIKNFSPKSKESRNIIMKINKSNIIKKVIGITSTLALTSGVVLAGNMVYENVWKEPESYKITNKISDEEINESISEEEAKNIVMKFFKENGIERNITELELVKDNIQNKVVWDISFNDGSITLDGKGNIEYLNIPTWNYKIPYNYSITREEARIAAEELLKKYNYNENSNEYELVSLRGNMETDEASYIWYADFYKKYGDLTNKYESISIGWIPKINGLYSLSFENNKFENNEQVINKDRAIEIATAKDKQIEKEKEIKECNAEIRIEKMNTNIYEREKDEEFYKQIHLNNEGDTIYKTEERVRKVWVVVIKYNTKELPDEISYYVDATTGEIIGGQIYNYFSNEEIIKNE